MSNLNSDFEGKLKLNKAMKSKLEGSAGYTKELERNLLSQPLFYENNGFFMIKKDSKEIKEVNTEKILKLYKDRTGYEASVNECRIEDYFDCEKDDGLKIAMQLAEIWEEELDRQFPDRIFYIIISSDEYSTTMRFYLYREDETIWIDPDNIDSYEEAIAVMITDL